MAYSIVFVYPFPNGLTYLNSVSSITNPGGWVRVILANKLAVDLDPTLQVMTDKGFRFPDNLTGCSIRVFDSPESIVINGETYSLTAIGRFYKVLGVVSLDAYESELAIAGVHTTSTNYVPWYALTGAPSYQSENELPSILVPEVNDFPLQGSPNPETSGTNTLNPTNNPLTAQRWPWGTLGTMWYIVDSVPASTEGKDGDLALDHITGNVYQKEGGVWSIVANMMGPQGPAGSGDKNYLYTQTSASSVWNIPHDLNKYPSVSVFDSSGNLVLADVEYVDANNVQIKFVSPFVGLATIN